MGLESFSYEASIDQDFSKNLYKKDSELSNAEKQKNLIINSRKDIQFGVKSPGVMPYNNIGLSSSILKYENSWMEQFDPDWNKNQTFLKMTTVDFA